IGDEIVLQNNYFLDKILKFRLYNPIENPCQDKQIFIFQSEGNIIYQLHRPNKGFSFYCGVGVFYVDQATWEKLDNNNILLNFKGGYPSTLGNGV
ncbi:MAG: hypothetical protein SFU99_01785, partial [Saprospiraceae bacterium]|nr:hypothetical protein [Saprospiraceae bacterium]